MPIETLHMRRFLGVNGAADPKDLQFGAAAYALNLDPAYSEGVFRGLPDKTSRLTTIDGEFYVPLTDRGVGVTHPVIYIENDGTPQARRLASDPVASVTNVADGNSWTWPANMNGLDHEGSSDGLSAHFALGHAASDNAPVWVGYNPHGQFSGAAGGWAAEDARLLTTAVAGVAVNTSTTGTVDRHYFPPDTFWQWGVSLVYDGTQETPVAEGGVSNGISTGATTYEKHTIDIDLTAADLNERVTAVMLYRARMSSGTTGEAGFIGQWQFVREVDINDATWTGTTTRSITVTDGGGLTTTFDDVNGFAGTLDHMDVRYTRSVAAGGRHIIADLEIEGLGDLPGWLMRSKPGRFSTFDWSDGNDFLQMPAKITALSCHGGLIIAWTEGVMYVIESTDEFGLKILDTYQGFGCDATRAAISTAHGLFWSDERGIYRFRGTTPERISAPIHTNTYDSPSGWENRGTTTPVALYESSRDLVIFAFEDGDGDIKAWCWNDPSSRWTLMDVADTTLNGGFVSASGRPYLALVDGGTTSLYELLSGSDQSWTFVSGQINDRGHPQVLGHVRLSQQPGTAAAVSLFEDDADYSTTPTSVTMTLQTGSDGEYKGIANSNAGSKPLTVTRSAALLVTGSVEVGQMLVRQTRIYP